MSPPAILYTWLEVDRFTRVVAKAIRDANYRPDVIVGIARGGCVPAVHLSHLLDVRAFIALEIQTTSSNAAYAGRLERPIINASAAISQITSKKVLLVDDAVSTGKTLQYGLDFLKQFAPSEVRTAILVFDTTVPVGSDNCSLEVMDFWAHEAHAWALFPWTA